MRSWQSKFILEMEIVLYKAKWKRSKLGTQLLHFFVYPRGDSTLMGSYLTYPTNQNLPNQTTRTISLDFNLKRTQLLWKSADSPIPGISLFIIRPVENFSIQLEPWSWTCNQIITVDAGPLLPWTPGVTGYASGKKFGGKSRPKNFGVE